MKKKNHSQQNHAFFITFSCYKRRNLLNTDIAKAIVIHYLSAQLKNQSGNCIGFVIMPNHVHAIVSFKRPTLLSTFINQWKRRSSIQLKKLYQTAFPSYNATIGPTDPIWQPNFYSFNIFSTAKITNKLSYIHNNPVKCGLVPKATDWNYSSARWYAHREPAGIPITPAINNYSIPMEL
jgi:putative transposase